MTNKEVSHEIAVEVWNNFIARPQNHPDKHKFSFKDLEKMIDKKLEPMKEQEEKHNITNENPKLDVDGCLILKRIK